MNLVRGRGDAAPPRAHSNHKLNFEQTARRLIATNIADALRCATDIRERIEIVHTSEYANFLRYLFPAFRNVLLHSSSATSARADETGTRFRHVILEILNRLPNNEVLRPYAPELLRVATETLSRDSEENALTCLRIIFDLHKNFRPALEGEVQSFLDLVQRIYRLLPTSINKAFAFSLQPAHLSKPKSTSRRIQIAYSCPHPSPLGITSEVISISNQLPGTSVLHRQTPVMACDAYLNPTLRIPSSKLASSPGLMPEGIVSTGSARTSTIQSVLQGLDSFKVLTECPLIVMLLFQLYPKYIQDNIPLLTPLMMGGLALRAPLAAYKLQRERYREFVACQVKTLSFLTYLLRGFSELMKPYEEAISKAVIALMIACPGDAVATRKELLVATRHILATEFRRGFYRHVDTLLDEKVLIGLGRPSRDALRPLAFSTLADLVHHVRAELNLSQLSRVVLLFSRNLHDPRLPLNVQTTSVRLLLNLVDFVFHNRDADISKGQRLLVHILQTLVSKFDTLRFLIHKIGCDNSSLDTCCDSNCRPGRHKTVEGSTDKPGSRHQNLYLGCSSVVLPAKIESMADVKPLIQMLIRGLKTVMWCISHYQQSQRSGEVPKKINITPEDRQPRSVAIESRPRPTARKQPHVLSQNEAEYISLFFYWGLLCCRAISSSCELQEFELKEVLDNFAGAFTVLDSFNFRSTVGQHIPMLFDAMLGSSALLAIAQTLLANSNVSATFADILVGFLVRKLSNLSSFQFPHENPSPRLVPSKIFDNGTYPTSTTKIAPCFGASTLLRLLRIILGSVALFPKNEVVLRGQLRKLIIACLQHAAATNNPIAYFFLLRSIFRSVSSCVSSRGVHSELGDIAPSILKVLFQLRLRTKGASTAHFILTELCMTVPMSLAAQVPFIPRLLPLLVEALQAISGDLPSLALRTLEYFLDHLGSSRTCSLLAGQPRLQYMMLIGVCSHLKPAPYTLGTIALRILGKLGGRNRHFLALIGDSLPDLSQRREVHIETNASLTHNSKTNHVKHNLAIFSPISSLRLLMKWRAVPCSTHSVNIQDAYSVGSWFALDIDNYLTDACELFNSLVRLNFLEHNSVQSSFQSYPPLLLRYQKMCFRLLASGLCSLFDLPAEAKIPKYECNKPQRKQQVDFYNCKVMEARVCDFANIRLCQLLYSVVCAAAHRMLEAEATPLLRAFAFLFAMLTHYTPTSSTEFLSRRNQDCEEQLGKVKLQHAHGKKHFQAPGDGKLSIHSFTSTLLEAITDSCSLVASTALGSLKFHLGCIYSLELRSLPAPRSILITDLITRICLSLSEWEIKSRRSVCQTLYELLATFGHAWARPNKDVLAAALISALDDEADITLLTHGGIIQTLHALLQISHNTMDETRLVNVFVRELSNKAAAARLGAQSGLIELNRQAKLPELSSQILKPIAASSAHILAKCHLGLSAPIDCTIGALDALSFMLSLHPPAILPNPGLHSNLLNILEKERHCLPAHYALWSLQPNCYLGWMSKSATFSFVLNHSILCLGKSSACSRTDYLRAMALRALHASIRAAKSVAMTAVSKVPSEHARAKFNEVLLSSLPLNHLRKTLDLALESARIDDAYILNLTSTSLLCEVLALRQLPLMNACSAYVRQSLDAVNQGSATLQFLSSFERMISLPVLDEIQSLEIARCLLNHLQEFCNPDGLKGMRSWIANPPLELAAKLLHLISRLLTCGHESTECVSTFLKSVVCTVLQLEAVLSKYFDQDVQGIKTPVNTMHLLSPLSAANFGLIRLGPSPFRFALAQFLSCHATAATHYFFNLTNIVNPEHISLLSFVVSVREAAELRMRVMSSDGIELLLNAAFRRPISSITQRSRVHERMKHSHPAILFTWQDKHQLIPDLEALNSRPAAKLANRSSFADGSSLPRLSFEERVEKKDQPVGLTSVHVRPVDSSVSVRESSVEVDQRLPASILNADTAHDQMAKSKSKEAQFYGLKLIMALYHLDIHLFSRHKLAGHCIIMLWRAHMLRADERATNSELTSQMQDELILRCHKETFLMIQGMIGYCRSYQEDVHVLFDMLSVFMMQSPVDFTFLKDFYREEVAVIWEPRNKQKLMLLFLRALVDYHVAMDLKVVALRLVVTPMLITTFTGARKLDTPQTIMEAGLESTRVVDSDMLALFMRSALDTANRQTRHYSEALRVELLKLTTVLIEHLGQELVEHRKDLIKFAWNHLKSDDSLSKQWAYVNVCRFVATYETPPKIILQVYVALLRTFQPEARELVKVALDILIPALPKRLPMADFIKAIKWTKKIMYEEGHALAQLVHMWQLVVRHPTLFYPYRSQFMPQMVNSLNRLGLPPNCPVENRQLAVALADLILNWESQRLDDSKPRNAPSTVGSQLLPEKKPVSPGHSTRPVPALSEDEFHLTMTMIEMVANFLVRLALFASDNKEPAVQRLAPRCLFLFKTTIEAWPNVHIRFSYFEKLIATSNTRLDLGANDSPYSPTLLATCLDVIHITLGVGSQPNTFFIDNLVKAQQLICPCFDMPNIEIQSKLREVVARIAELYPPGHSSSTIMFFYHQIKCVVESRLTAVVDICCSSSRQGANASYFHKAPNAMPLVKVIASICRHTPSYILNHGYSLLKLAQIFLRHHLNSIQKCGALEPPTCYATPVMSVLARAIKSRLSLSETEQVQGETVQGGSAITALCTCILLLAQAVTDNIIVGIRRELVVLVFVCLDRSPSIELLLCVSKLASIWLTNVNSPLTKREKIAFIEHVADIDYLTESALQPLFTRFLKVVKACVSKKDDDKRRTSGSDWCDEKNIRCKNLVTTGLLALHPGARAEFRGIYGQGITNTNTMCHHLVHMLQSDWSPLSNRFWVVIVIEFMLDGIDTAGPIKLPSDTMTLSNLPSKEPGEISPSTGCADARLQQQYRTACSYISERRETLQQFIEPLKELIHAHLRLAERVWEDLLPQVCHVVEGDQRHTWEVALTDAIFNQVTAVYHQPRLKVPSLLLGDERSVELINMAHYYETNHNFSVARFSPASSGAHSCFLFDSMETIIPPPNVPRTLLRACYDLLPKCLATSKNNSKPLGLLRAAASKYNCRHEALYMMEEAVIAQQNFSSCSSSHNPRISGALMFSELMEADLRARAINDSCTHPMSSVAFALRCYGFIPQAQEVFFKNMIESLSHEAQHEVWVETSTSGFSFEADVWCDEWLACARDMSQWALLVDLLKQPSARSPVSTILQTPGLLLEAAWKIYKWNDVRQELSAGSQHSGHNGHALKVTGPKTKLLETRLAIVDGRYSDVEQLCSECIQLALNSWCNLPRPRLGLATHDPLLHLFHELIEVHESGQLLNEAIQHSRALTYPDLRTVAHTWRDRLPNEWDSISDWDDVMRWRAHVFQSVQKAFVSWGTADHISELHDAPWTVAMLTRVARKQGLVQAIQTIKHASDANGTCNDLRMNVSDAFSKLRERILAYDTKDGLVKCNNAGHEARTRAQAGLYLIKNTAIDLFNTEQRSELLRLKALYQGVLGQYRDAHSTFSAATNACNTYGRAWYSWGALCDANSAIEVSSNSFRHLVQNSFTCYLAAVECGYAHAFVSGMARILCLLRLDGQHLDLAEKFHARIHNIPITAWVPWIPQLLVMLDVNHIQHVICSLTACLPQAVYYSLQPQLLPNINRASELSRLHAHQVITHFRFSSAKLAAEMDILSGEIILGVRPSPTEELLHLLFVILTQCHNTSIEVECEGPCEVYQLLHKVSVRYTHQLQYDVFDNHDMWGKVPASEHVASKLVERNAIRTSANHADLASPQSLTGRLQSWSRVLASHLNRVLTYKNPYSICSTLSKLQYEQEDPECCQSRLAVAQFLEIPGQYTNSFGTLRPELHLPLLKFEAHANIRIRRGRVMRRLRFVADEGRVQAFVSSVKSKNHAFVNERVCQFFGIVDVALTQCSEAQRRRLRVSPMGLVRFASNIQLTEDRWSWTNLHEVNESRLSILGKTRDSLASPGGMRVEPLVSKLRSLDRSLHEAEDSARKALYNRICSNNVDADTFCKHVSASLEGIEAVWTYRRTFATQLAVPSILGFILAVGNRAAHTAIFCQYSGRVCAADFHPCISSASSYPEPHLSEMPFRLTRNIERVLQPFLFNGVFKSSLGSISFALQHTLEPGGFLEPYVYLYLGDERTDVSSQNVPAQSHVLKKTIQIIKSRIQSSAPPRDISSSVVHVESGLSKLVEQALSPDNIATMLPQWQPWL